MQTRWISPLLLVLSAAVPASAAGGVLNPGQDASLIQVSTIGSTQLANGIGPNIFAGRSGQSSNFLRRSLLHFDVVDNLPSWAVITSVSLTMNVQQAASALGAPANTPVGIHELSK